jgi:hypothetical protein
MNMNRLKLKKFIGLLAVAIVAVLSLAPPSHAGGTSVSVGIGVGYPGWGYPGWGYPGWGYRGWWGPGPWGYRPYWGTGVYFAPPPIVVGPPATYVSPPTVVQQAPPADSPAPQPEQYWYYCQESQAYYPYVKQCPHGWMKVVPQAQPPAR